MHDRIGQLRMDFAEVNGIYPSYLIVSMDNYNKMRADAQIQSNRRMDDFYFREYMGMRVCVMYNVPDEYMDVAGSRDSWNLPSIDLPKP